MRRITLILGLTILAVIVIAACSDDDNGTGPVSTFEVSGDVLAYFCGIDDFMNNSGDPRYTVRTYRPAFITLTDRRGREHWCLTDDSSAYRFDLEEGEYDISIYADYVRPIDLGSVVISSDTTLDLKIVYDFYTDGHYLFGNFYYPDGDTLGQSAEVAALDRLSDAAGHVIWTGSIERDHVSQIGPAVHVSYRLPIDLPIMNFEAFDSLHAELSSNSELYPSELSLDPGNYICMY